MNTRALTIPEGYEVTAEGRVYSTKKGVRRELRQWPNGSGAGYPSVFIYENGRKRFIAVYRLVAAAHLPPRPSPTHCILHCDGDHTNSAASNLRWGTPSENGYDRWRHRRERLNGALPIEATDDCPF